MKVIWWNITRIFSCFSFIVDFIKGIFGRGRNRKNSGTSSTLPVLKTEESHLQQNNESTGHDSEWVEWGNDDHFSIKIEPTSPPPTNQQQSVPETNPSLDPEDLFKDMTPVFKKPKKIVIKSREAEPAVHSNNSPSRLNFDMNYPPSQTDLGAWEDTSSGWEEDEISEREIEWETENAIKQKRQAERERRALEQQRRKEEREEQRQARKHHQQFGVKVNS